MVNSNGKSSSNNDKTKLSPIIMPPQSQPPRQSIDAAKIFYEEVLAKQAKAAAQAKLYNQSKKQTTLGFVDKFTDFVMSNTAFVGVIFLIFILFIIIVYFLYILN